MKKKKPNVIFMTGNNEYLKGILKHKTGIKQCKFVHNQKRFFEVIKKAKKGSVIIWNDYRKKRIWGAIKLPMNEKYR